MDLQLVYIKLITLPLTLEHHISLNFIGGFRLGLCAWTTVNFARSLPLHIFWCLLIHKSSQVSVFVLVLTVDLSLSTELQSKLHIE